MPVRGIGSKRPLEMNAVFDLIGRLQNGVHVRDSIDDMLGCGANDSLAIASSVEEGSVAGGLPEIVQSPGGSGALESGASRP